MSKKKNKSGGKRTSAGRKGKYGEPTTTIAFRVPESKVDEVRETVNELIGIDTKPENKSNEGTESQG